jgi:hypothetical protein
VGGKRAGQEKQDEHFHKFWRFIWQ